MVGGGGGAYSGIATTDSAASPLLLSTHQSVPPAPLKHHMAARIPQTPCSTDTRQ